MASFCQYHPLFLEALTRNELGVCQWFESGTTIDSAVPGLRELTDDKAEWRAIIVRVENDEDMAKFHAGQHNPYDFNINYNAGVVTDESPIPLVRLTHILGGIPAPEVKFESELIVEKNKSPRVIYKPMLGSEDDKIYKKLSNQYTYDGRLPSEIVLISLREKLDNRFEESQKLWNIQRENTSSEFWKRNGYPSTCRFLFFETEKQGPVQKKADMFRLWTSVLLLATNDIDPSSMQAYKLYKLDTVIDEKILGKMMKAVVNQLIGAQGTIKESINNDRVKKLHDTSNRPYYRMEAPVEFDYTSGSMAFPNPKAFGFAPTGIQSDIVAWDDMRQSAESDINDAYHATSRILDQSTEKMRMNSLSNMPALRELDKYEVQDLQWELADIHRGMSDCQSSLPQSPSAPDTGITKAAEAVKEKILKRITVSQAILGLVTVIGLFLLSFIPAATYLKHQPNGSSGILLSAFGILFLVLGLATLAVLFFKRLGLIKAVKSYIESLKNALTALLQSAQNYSQYLGDVGSYTRGSVYLSELMKKNYIKETAISKRKIHLRAIEAMLQSLREWSTAYHLSVNFEGNAVENNVIVDTNCPPSENPLYTFEFQSHYTVQLNYAGDVVSSPFEFISKLKIVREELYDE